MKDTVHRLLSQLSDYFPDTPFAVEYWSGEVRRYGSGDPAFLLRLRSLAGVKRGLRNGPLGFAEAYMDGEIDVDGNLSALLKFQTAPFYDVFQLSLIERIRFLLSVVFTQDTAQGAKKNVSHHYDLGNDFYRLWLDSSMTYTCAYFRSPTDSLEQAQRNKHEHICRKLRLQPGQTLIDVGCGWGAMMFYAAEQYGVRCAGYTLSEQQYARAQEQIEARGLRGQVEIHLKDYREAEGQFDRFVSIGMFEQVGRPFIQTYFREVKRLLKPGGVGVLHTIGSAQSIANHPWIERYIFPGGYIPTLPELIAPMNEFDLNAVDIEDLRLHYGETLDNWHARFRQHIPEVVELYGERFVRMWTLYLLGSAVSFRYGPLRLYQLTFTHGLDNTLPRTREYVYDAVDPTPAFNLPPPVVRA